jgi:hypothetical protein
MKVSGFTLIRNGTEFDYPYVESLRSLLPLVDELVVNVGTGTDGTLQRIQEFARTEGQGKVVCFESLWPLDDPEKKKGGLILSEQTNLALDRCKGEWCIYLQADEVLHEADAKNLRQAMERNCDDTQVEGLLFDYVHFYGSFDVVQDTRSRRCAELPQKGRLQAPGRSRRRARVSLRLGQIPGGHARENIFHGSALPRGSVLPGSGLAHSVYGRQLPLQALLGPEKVSRDPSGRDAG